MTIREAIEGMNITNEYDYRIGFIYAEGRHDETELSADNNEDLERTYEEFCEENNFPKDTVTYFDLVTHTSMEMNVGKLKEIIKNLPNDMPVFVACQGYCNYDFDREQPCEDTDTFGIVHDGKLFITDDCAVETGNGTL